MELLDVLDEDGNVTGKTEDKDIIHKLGIWHREIAVLIQNQKGEYLIQKRSANKKQAPNKWELTAGHIDAGETFEHAAIRETKEEIGIDIKVKELKVLGTFKQPYKSIRTTNNNYTRYYYYKTDKQIQEYSICLEELSELKYISFEELKEVVKRKDDNYSFTKRTAMSEIIKILENIQE